MLINPNREKSVDLKSVLILEPLV